MGQPSHKQYALATYLMLFLMLLIAAGMIALVINNA